ncbi:MAG: helix-turn-helix transcriptional regulator [Gammaproteobacteria bacterium]|nr:helix-turn-helix transcriptional regulator [Gammaproteobacteria bacterium]
MTPQASSQDVGDNNPAISRVNNFAALRDQVLQQKDSSAEQLEVVGNDYVRLILKPPLGRGYVDFIQFAPDFLAVISDSEYHGDMQFNYVGESWARFNFRLSGGSVISFDGCQHEELGGRTSHIFAQPQGLTQCDKYVTGEPSRWVSILCKRKRLTENLGLEIERLPRRFADFLEGNEGDLYFTTAGLSHASEMLVSQLLKPPKNLTLRPLYLKSKIYGLLYTYLDEIFRIDDPPRNLGSLNQRDIGKLEEGRHILEKDMLNSLNMYSLSRKIGLNRNKLSYGFRDYFGITIFDFCKQTRLKKAYEMLLDTELSILQIADAVGYTHASSLTVAFKAYYGRTPIQVRNGIRKNAANPAS